MVKSPLSEEGEWIEEDDDVEILKLAEAAEKAGQAEAKEDGSEGLEGGVGLPERR